MCCIAAARLAAAGAGGPISREIFSTCGGPLNTPDGQSDDGSASPVRSRGWLRWLWYTLLLVGGGVAVAAFIHHYGADRIGAALWQALPWLPVLLALEATWIGADALVWRAFLGRARARSIPLRVWWRASMTAYMVMIILPAGRAGGEIARAFGFARYIGRPAATAGCVHTLGSGLVGNAIISLPCAVVSGVVVGWAHWLTWLIAGNGLITLLLGVGTLLAPRRIGIGQVLARRDGRWMESGAAFDEMWQRSVWLTGQAVLWSGLGRVVQTLLLATILLALGELSAAWQPVLAEGIYLVSAALGDFSPNQIGVTEGVFVMFGHLADLDRAASALAIALVIRTVQFSCAALCLLGAMVLGRARTAPDPDAGPDPDPRT